MRPGEAVHAVPAYVPICDPIWEATRTERSPVTHRVLFDIEQVGNGWRKVEPESVPCYSPDEAEAVKRRLIARGRQNVRVEPAVLS